MANKKEKDNKRKPFDKRETIESLILYFVIVSRDQSKYFIDRFNKAGISMNMVVYGYSDPPEEIQKHIIAYDTLKKDIILTFCKYSDINKIHEIIEERFKVSNLAKGVAFGVPIDSVAGIMTYKFLSDYNNKEKKDNEK